VVFFLFLSARKSGESGLNMVREYTNKLIELCDEGILSKEQIFNEFMCYLSEDDVKEFCLTSFGGELRVVGLFKGLRE
jgi:hypothetical protein